MSIVNLLYYSIVSYFSFIQLFSTPHDALCELETLNNQLYNKLQ